MSSSTKTAKVCTRGILGKTLKTAGALNSGVMVVTIMGNIPTAKNTAREFTIGQMGQNIMESGNKTKCMAKGNLFGQMAESITGHS